MAFALSEPAGAAVTAFGSREGAKTAKKTAARPIPPLRATASPRAILLPMPVRRLPRQGNHETDERNVERRQDEQRPQEPFLLFVFYRAVEPR